MSARARARSLFVVLALLAGVVAVQLSGASASPGSALTLLASWLDRRQPAFEALGITVVTTWGPQDRAPASAWVDFGTSEKPARLIIWDTGLADLTVGDFVKGEVLLEEHREITSAVGLDDVEATVRTWLVEQP